MQLLLHHHDLRPSLLPASIRKMVSNPRSKRGLFASARQATPRCSRTYILFSYTVLYSEYTLFCLFFGVLCDTFNTSA